jgi:hypothetical protein
LLGQTAELRVDVAWKAAGTGCAGGFDACNAHAEQPIPIKIHGNAPCDKDILVPVKWPHQALEKRYHTLKEPLCTLL